MIKSEYTRTQSNEWDHMDLCPPALKYAVKSLNTVNPGFNQRDAFTRLYPAAMHRAGIARSRSSAYFPLSDFPPSAIETQETTSATATRHSVTLSQRYRHRRQRPRPLLCGRRPRERRRGRISADRIPTSAETAILTGDGSPGGLAVATADLGPRQVFVGQAILERPSREREHVPKDIGWCLNTCHSQLSRMWAHSFLSSKSIHSNCYGRSTHCSPQAGLGWIRRRHLPYPAVEDRCE
jgi:hypothetical protein